MMVCLCVCVCVCVFGVCVCVCVLGVGRGEGVGHRVKFGAGVGPIVPTFFQLLQADTAASMERREAYMSVGSNHLDWC